MIAIANRSKTILSYDCCDHQIFAIQSLDQIYSGASLCWHKINLSPCRRISFGFFQVSQKTQTNCRKLDVKLLFAFSSLCFCIPFWIYSYCCGFYILIEFDIFISFIDKKLVFGVSPTAKQGSKNSSKKQL